MYVNKSKYVLAPCNFANLFAEVAIVFFANCQMCKQILTIKIKMVTNGF